MGFVSLAMAITCSLLWCSFVHYIILPFGFVTASFIPAQLSYPEHGFTGSTQLSVGFNLSIAASFNVVNRTSDYPIDNAILTTALRSRNGTYFFPILSSPSFHSANGSQSLGFSFGFLITSDLFNMGWEPKGKNHNIYLVVCGGVSGNYSQFNVNNLTYTFSDSTSYTFKMSAAGFVVPISIVNQNTPLKTLQSSLSVVSGNSSNSNELRLTDGDGTVVWNVSNVGMVEIHDDTGRLVIYSGSSNKSQVVWQTSSTNILFQGQRMNEGMQLTSSDSVYSARMEMGGLVLYLNTVNFGQQHPAPYWIIPQYFTNTSINTTLTTLVSFGLSACSRTNDPAYISLHLIDPDSPLELVMKPDGSCRSNHSTVIFRNVDDALPRAWSFLRLANDGKLYVHSVMIKSTDVDFVGVATQAHSLDDDGDWYEIRSIEDGNVVHDLIGNVVPVMAANWLNCDTPLACGPLGLCTPDAATPCSCPSDLEPWDVSDLTKGCRRPLNLSLPTCTRGDEHINTTYYHQLHNTSTIFLFNNWNFTSIPASVEACKTSCSSNCSCNGFFYVHAQYLSSPSCFLMMDELSLLRITGDINLSSLTLSPMNSTMHHMVLARDYDTFLKLTLMNSDAAYSSNKFANNIVVMSAVIPSAVAFVLLVMGVYFLVRARNRRYTRMQEQAEEDEVLQDIMPLLPNRFSYQDLHQATRGFSKLLGSGACGSVYAGALSDGRMVAVKILDIMLKGNQSKQFLAEIATIGRTNHVNIVRLVGFCWEGSAHRLLVYEYVDRGSLDQWLFPKVVAESSSDRSSNIASAPLLDWHTRYNVAIGIARGLSYLHEECTQPILHFDIKPQNILLDNEFTAKLADFGMSRLMQKNVSEVVTGVRGTPGYIAPEWIYQKGVSTRSDMYSMGVVMLEIVAGRKCMDLELLINAGEYAEEEEAWHLPSWAATKCEQGLAMEVADKGLRSLNGFDAREAERLIYTAFWCIQQDPSFRPSASMAVQWLEGSAPIKEPSFRAPQQNLDTLTTSENARQCQLSYVSI